MVSFSAARDVAPPPGRGQASSARCRARVRGGLWSCGVVFGPPGVGYPAGTRVTDIAGDRRPRGVGEEVKIGAGEERAVADGAKQSLQAPPQIDLVDLAGLGIGSGGDLLGNETAGI